MLDCAYGGKRIDDPNELEGTTTSTTDEDDEEIIDADLLEEGLPDEFGESLDLPHHHTFPTFKRFTQTAKFHA